MSSSSTLPQVKAQLVTLLTTALATSGVSGGQVPVQYGSSTLPSRLLRRVEIDANGCWVWQGTLQPNGYGMISLGGRGDGIGYIHRVSYTLFVGPIPEGLVIDHLCRNRACCNPEHLEPVTQLENTHRGIGHGSETHCPQGHPYDEANTIHRRDGRRRCRACKNARERRRYQRRKSA